MRSTRNGQGGAASGAGLQAPDGVTLRGRADTPPPPAAAQWLFWCDSNGIVHALAADGVVALALSAGTAALTLDDGFVVLADGIAAQLSLNNGVAGLSSAGASLTLLADGGELIVGNGMTFRLTNVATVDPHVVGALWIAPLTRQLMVSAG